MVVFFAFLFLAVGLVDCQEWTLPMTCYPSPYGFNSGPPPTVIPYPTYADIPRNPCYPCWEPSFTPNPNLTFPDEFKAWSLYPNVMPSGEAQVHEFYGNSLTKQRYDITLRGFPEHAKITAWGSYGYPFIAKSPHSYFGNTSELLVESAAVPHDASTSFAFAPTTERFSDGLYDYEESNVFTYYGQTHRATINLDYYFTQPGQGPMRNGRSVVTQKEMEHEELKQVKGLQNDDTAIASAFIRVFNHTTGQQVLGADGRPLLARSPVKGRFIALIVHLDGQTHGINPGTAVSRRPGFPWYGADHYLIGIIDLEPITTGERDDVSCA